MPFSDSVYKDVPKCKDVLERILKYTVEGVAIIGADLKVEYVNDQVCRIFDQLPDEILGQSFLTFVHPEDRIPVKRSFDDLLKGEPHVKTTEIRVLQSGDRCRYLQVRTSILTDGDESLKILAQALDVTEKRKTICALSDYEMKYSTLLETMNEGLGIINDQGVYVYANAALCKMLSYSKTELVGKHVGDIMHGPSLDEVSVAIRDRITGKSSRYGAFLIHRSGSLIPTQVSASPLFSETGEYRGSLAICTDARAYERLKKDLQTARNRALLYIDLIGHDIRNHLQEILLSTELLKYRIEEPSSLDLLESITRSVSRSAHIITETKTIEELDELPLRERSLDMVLNETVQAAILLYDEVTFNMSIQVSKAQVLADDFLELLLSDLLSHACEQCEDGHRRVWIKLAESEHQFELTISDNRPLGSKENLNSVFDIGKRLSGLRLHLTRFIVEKYGGLFNILDRVENDMSQGTSIKVAFPKAPEV